MIAKTEITRNLTSLNHRYGRAKTQKEALFFAKLALIELCGWIEMSMDDIVLKCAKRKLKSPPNMTYIEGVVKGTYGFNYDKHFRKMLIALHGITGLEQIEKKADRLKFARLTSTLGDLKRVRDAEAHTFIKGVTRNIDAPSVNLQRFRYVYEGLLDIEKISRNI